MVCLSFKSKVIRLRSRIRVLLKPIIGPREKRIMAALLQLISSLFYNIQAKREFSPSPENQQVSRSLYTISPVGLLLDGNCCRFHWGTCTFRSGRRRVGSSHILPMSLMFHLQSFHPISNHPFNKKKPGCLDHFSPSPTSPSAAPHKSTPPQSSYSLPCPLSSINSEMHPQSSPTSLISHPNPSRSPDSWF
jgi:hypothetical protein